MNTAPEMRGRTYRAHGRINPKVSSPCRAEMVLAEKEQVGPKPEEEVAQKTKIPQKKLKKQKLTAWESIQHKINANKSRRKKRKIDTQTLVIAKGAVPSGSWEEKDRCKE